MATPLDFECDVSAQTASSQHQVSRCRFAGRFRDPIIVGNRRVVVGPEWWSGIRRFVRIRRLSEITSGSCRNLIEVAVRSLTGSCRTGIVSGIRDVGIRDVRAHGKHDRPRWSGIVMRRYARSRHRVPPGESGRRIADPFPWVVSALVSTGCPSVALKTSVSTNGLRSRHDPPAFRSARRRGLRVMAVASIGLRCGRGFPPGSPLGRPCATRRGGFRAKPGDCASGPGRVPVLR